MLKTTAMLEYPKGTQAALEDLDSWLREFDRAVSHVSSNKGPMAADRISHLLAALPAESDIGTNMRLDQQSIDYLRFEQNG